MSGGRSLRLGRYTPFGLAVDPAGTLGGAVLPQWQSMIAALNGEDWKGAPLRHADGTPFSQPELFAEAFHQFGLSTVPFLSAADSLVGVPVVGSTTTREKQDKGPVGQRLQRQFNPFYPVQPTGSSRGGGGGLPSNLREQLRGPAGGSGLDGVKDLREQLKAGR